MQTQHRILGRCFFDPEVLEQVMRSSDGTEFTGPLADVFAAISNLYEIGAEVHAVAVAEEMNRLGTYRQPETIELLMELLESA